MDKGTTTTSTIAAWVLYIVNFIFMTACLLIFSFGLWIICSPSSVSSAIDASGSIKLKAFLQDTLTLSVGVGLAAVATLVFFVCFMGFYGALARSHFLLFMYSALVLLLLALECALLYYFSSNLVEKGLQDDGQWTHFMRLSFQCCDYNLSSPSEVKKPPWSCCGPETYPNNCTAILFYKQDCHTPIAHWLDRYQLPIYTSLAVFHVILASCSIVRRSCVASRSHS